MATTNTAFKVKNGLELGAIAATIADTAVDIFVYDTRKDSDGGAWRKRTQHTSWYNETLNTATRGSRKEFPAVAVIVGKSNGFTIYDGDDPTLPMWKSFIFGGEYPMYYYVAGLSSCTAHDGKIVTSSTNTTPSNGGGCRVMDFVADKATVISGFYGGDVGYVTHGLSYASLSAGTGNKTNRPTTDGYLVNTVANDVAMTVLPNAPIDAATGLPVPTIAVATDGGVSVIKDDGTVVDITQSHGGTTSVDMLTIDPVTNAIYFTTDYGGSGTPYKINAVPIPSADRSENTSTYNSFQDHFFQIQSAGNNAVPHLINTGSNSEALDINVLQATGEGAFAVGEGLGLDHILEDRSGLTNSMIAYTTSDYATGWMNGDIKLATLSDTDATNVTGSELVTNGTFDSDLTGWTTGFGGSTGGTIEQSSGALVITQGTNSVWMGVYQAVDVSGVDTVTVSLERTAVSGGGTLRVGLNTTANVTSSPVRGYAEITGSNTGIISETFNVSGDTTLYLVIAEGSGSGNSSTVDNVTLRLAEEDRSVNGNGLQVFGTVTKSAVATGADLVAYSGFSGVTPSIYLKQPVGPNLTTGTLALVWYKASILGSTYGFMGQGGNTSAGYGFGTNASSGTLNGRIVASGGTVNIGSSSVIADNTWKCIAVTYDGSAIKVYINGVLDTTNTGTSGDITSSDDFYVGAGITSVGFRGGSGAALALARVSATVLSPEQILKIYNDEKVLFQEGAQATLYGSSDAVTALAYDDSTNLLHVGTSAGRSVFQGLRRVDNTTTAVGAAISASNGLVADE